MLEMERVIVGACAVLGGLALLALPSQGSGPEPRAPQPFRLDRRVPLTTSRVTGWPDPPPPYRTRRVLAKLALRNPVYLTSDAAHPGLFVVEQAGRVLYVPPKSERAEPFCTIGDHD